MKGDVRVVAPGKLKRRAVPAKRTLTKTTRLYVKQLTPENFLDAVGDNFGVVLKPQLRVAGELLQRTMNDVNYCAAPRRLARMPPRIR
jgi:hypothetical protein